MEINSEIPVRLTNQIAKLHDKLLKHDFLVSLYITSFSHNSHSISAYVSRSEDVMRRKGDINIELAIEGTHSDTKPITAYIRKLNKLLASLELLEKSL